MKKPHIAITFDRAQAILACMPVILEARGYDQSQVGRRIVRSIAQELDLRLAKMAARMYEGRKRLYLREHEALVLRELLADGYEWSPEEPLLRQDLRQTISELDALIVGSRRQ